MDECKPNLELHKRYVQAMIAFKGYNCEVHCHENTNLVGKYQTMAPTSDYIILSDVATPTGSVSQCAIRTSDVIKLKWNMSK